MNISRHRSSRLHAGLLISAIVFAAPALATTYYVSKAGSDTNNGTLAYPFLTIQKAASTMVAGDSCQIMSGVYREVVTPANSGTAAAPISFGPYPGAQVVVSGADLIVPAWTVYSGTIYRASIPTVVRQLFLDGNMMNEARWPNASINNLIEMSRALVDSTTAATNITCLSLPPGNLVGAKAHIFPGTVGGEYYAYTRPITGHNITTKTISWASAVGMQIKPGNPFYVFGSLNLLDAPGEWYLDSAASTLYVWSPDSQSPASHTLEIKTRDHAFVLDNKSNIKLNGLFVFGAGISMLNTTSCTVSACHVRYAMHETSVDGSSSTVTIACRVGGTGSTWENSSLLFSSQTGITITGANATVRNCYISDVDYFPGGYYSAVTLSGSGHKVLNNTLYDSGRFLVMHSATGVEIAYNDMGWATRLTKDGGATYTFDFNGNNSLIHHNWVHDSDVGIYLDNNTSNFKVYRNVSWDNRIGIQLNSPSTNNTVVNNTLISNPKSFYTWDPSGTPTQPGTVIKNNLADGTMTFASGAGAPILAKNGWYPSVGADFVPLTGSLAIDGGDIVSPYTDGFIGSAPDIGAYEVGAAQWTAGSSTTIPPIPGVDLQGASYIVDNTDTGNVVITGAWTTTTSTPGYWGSNYLHDGNSGSTGGKKIKFSPALLSAGKYDVYLWWSSGSNRATNAPVDIASTSGVTTLSVNQSSYGGRDYAMWRYLGTFDFAAGTFGSVTMRNDGANGYVIADAVKFIKVASSLPAPWKSQDIGAISAGGSALYDGAAFNMAGAGSGISGTTDEFRYTYQSSTGDCDIKVRITAVGNASPGARAGVMIRESLAANSKYAAVMITPADEIEFSQRESTGGNSATTTGLGTSVAGWLRVVRSGNVFRGYRSEDGANWTLVGEKTIAMGMMARVGLVITSGLDGLVSEGSAGSVSATP